MANFVNTTLENPSYVVAFNSFDKVSGLNNCATFQINWDDFLPREIQKYKVTFSFQTAGGYYLDNTAGGVTYSSALIYVNWGGRSFSFDTTNKGSTQFLGTIQRDIQVAGTGASASNNLSTYYLANAPRTISRPNQNFITISIYNTSLFTANANPYTRPNTGTAATSPIGFVTTNSGGVAQTDMTNWVMLAEFIPLYDEVVKTQGTPF
jgi:hypothetical protein